MTADIQSQEQIGVYEAIVAIQGALSRDGISKARQAQGYAFRGIDDIYNALSGLLAEHRLCIIPRVVARQCVERTAKSGGALFYVTVEAEFDLVGPDGSKHTARTIGEAMDSSDKATNKAMSAAYKYMCFQLFCIPTEAIDSETATHEVVAAKRIAEEKAKKAANRPTETAQPAATAPSSHIPASQGPATKPETIREMADFLNAPPEAPLAAMEQRHAAKEREVADVLKDAAASKPAAKKAVIPVSADMLKAFGEIKKLLNDIEGGDRTYYGVLVAAGYAKSNQIQTREEGSRVYKLLVAELTALKEKRVTIEEIEERANVIGPNRFAAFIRDTMKLSDVEFEQASNEQLLNVVAVMRELKYGDA